jgi:hypothetical protein
MIWLYRFIWGLPAREADKQEILENFPELLENPEIINDAIFFGHLVLFRHDKMHDEFKKWISEYKHENIQGNCPLLDCPAKGTVMSQFFEEEQTILQLMRVGGYTKPPKSSFFDLVRKVHGQPNIKKVILTDPYILIDISEDVTYGGLENLKEYLETLGLNSNSSFELKISPSPKMYTESRYNNFKKYLLSKFPNVTIGRYQPKYEFHDRFYLVEDSSGNLNGVFGPSLNGLSSKAIVLYGELEIKGAIDKMGKWFD